MRPRLAVTAGEPAGIGPDLCVHLQGHPFPADVVIVADPELLRERARVLKMPLVMSPWCPGQPFPAPDVLAVWPVSTVVSRAHGILTSQNAAYVLETITMAAKACLRGDFEAMVTGPISKASVNDAGYAFSGHTEFLAEITGGILSCCSPRQVFGLLLQRPICRFGRFLRRSRGRVWRGRCVSFITTFGTALGFRRRGFWSLV